ncbi:hypothetical protein, partial [Actinoplanes sp. NPDC005259]|uniref:hypothetical protein n=1 Tax=Actinoplanes sp. NPDC005259 TaxID=3154674 RepID=UPI0033B9F605
MTTTMPPRRVPTRLADLAVPSIFLLAGLWAAFGQTAPSGWSGLPPAPTWLVVVSVVVYSAVLVPRRHWPLTVFLLQFLVFGGSLALSLAFGYLLTFASYPALLVGLYSVAVHRSKRVLIWALASFVPLCCLVFYHLRARPFLDIGTMDFDGSGTYNPSPEVLQGIYTFLATLGAVMLMLAALVVAAVGRRLPRRAA